MCPGRPLAVIDHVDADDKTVRHRESIGAKSCDRHACATAGWPQVRFCPSLWAEGCLNASSRLIRVVGAPAYFNRRLRNCPTISMPWLSHSRSASAAPARERRVRVAFAAGVAGHADSARHGFDGWRRTLRNECVARRNGSVCARTYQSLQGGMSRAAVELCAPPVCCVRARSHRVGRVAAVWLPTSRRPHVSTCPRGRGRYAQSVFCLQPPGDTIPRSGIVDAISVGCIPVPCYPATLLPHAISVGCIPVPCYPATPRDRRAASHEKDLVLLPLNTGASARRPAGAVAAALVLTERLPSVRLVKRPSLPRPR